MDRIDGSLLVDSFVWELSLIRHPLGLYDDSFLDCSGDAPRIHGGCFVENDQKHFKGLSATPAWGVPKGIVNQPGDGFQKCKRLQCFIVSRSFLFELRSYFLILVFLTNLVATVHNSLRVYFQNLGKVDCDCADC